MNNKTNTSRISILFGDDINDNEKASVQFKLNLTAKAAEEQARNLNSLLNERIDPMNSIVLLFPVLPQNQEDFEKLIRTIFTGEANTRMSKDLSTGYSKKFINFEIVTYSEQILVVIKNDIQEKKLLQEIKDILGKGLSYITKNQTNSAVLSFKSLNSFYDIESYFKEGESFASCLCRSLKSELKLDLDAELTSKLVEFMKQYEPKLANTPIGLLTFFKDLNIEMRFGGTDELPEYLRPLFSPLFLKNGLSASKLMPDPDKIFWNQFAKYCESGIEVFITIEDLGALHITTNTPGYSAHFIRNIGMNL